MIRKKGKNKSSSLKAWHDILYHEVAKFCIKSCVVVLLCARASRIGIRPRIDALLISEPGPPPTIISPSPTIIGKGD